MKRIENGEPDAGATSMMAMTVRLDGKHISRYFQKVLCSELRCTNKVLFHDLEWMRKRLTHLRKAFPKGALHALAIKANPLIEILREAVACGVGLEAASWEEVKIALAAGCEPSRIVFNSVVRTSEELENALTLGVIINANSLEELERVAVARQGRASASLIGLRINPLVGAGNIEITSVATPQSRFGVPSEHTESIVNAFRRYPWLVGLHVHIGSQGCSLPQMSKGVAQIQRLREGIEAELGKERVRFMDIGGGLPARYSENDSQPTPDDYVILLRECAPGLFDPRVRIITEFGRWIQASCGWAVSRIEWIRQAPFPLVSVHLGADFLLRPVYRPDAWRHEFLLLGRDGAVKRGNVSGWTIGGPLCFGGDVLARGVQLPSPEAGDFLVIRDAGAYTLSLWSRHCNHGMPLVLGADNGDISVLREAETADDVATFWSRNSWK